MIPSLCVSGWKGMHGVGRSSEPVMKWTYKTHWITRFLSVLASARGMLLA
ncbi:Uncharacterised protein [Vibrio cholerae]|nr:Uncharacterised protein [Vibrio cholerae]